jgi:hypothetical protein
MVRRVSWLLLAAMGCSEASAPVDPTIIPSDASAPPTEQIVDAGCSRTVTDLDAGKGAGCAAAWLCADAGLLRFVCTRVDGGAQCDCLGSSVSVDNDVGADPCQAATIGPSASMVCGWEVP